MEASLSDTRLLFAFAMFLSSMMCALTVLLGIHTLYVLSQYRSFTRQLQDARKEVGALLALVTGVKLALRHTGALDEGADHAG